jgi:sigma-E factor negative regulatory protein RseA
MQEDIKQKISRLVDEDLSNNDALTLLNNMRNDKAMRLKMGRYMAIKQAVKVNNYQELRSDFLDSISSQIQYEPNFLIPKKQQTVNYKYYAVAASIAMVAILSSKSFFSATVLSPIQQSSTAATNSQQLASAQTHTQAANKKPLNAQFNAYLQAHNSSVYTNGEADFHPYARITAYGQD